MNNEYLSNDLYNEQNNLKYNEHNNEHILFCDV